jgi:hypothetical protein
MRRAEEPGRQPRPAEDARAADPRGLSRLRLHLKDVRHMLQSARVARENGVDEKVIMAALGARHRRL